MKLLRLYIDRFSVTFNDLLVIWSTAAILALAVYVTLDKISLLDDNNDFLTQLNIHDEQFLRRFNSEVWRWIREHHKLRRSKGEETEFLMGMVYQHQENLARVTHFKSIAEMEAFRVNAAERTVLSALHLNASDTEVWKAAQTYLETISYIRILHLELRIAQFLSNIPSNAPQVVDSLINSDNVMSRSFKLKLPSVLLVKMENYLEQFKLMNMPGIKEGCVVLNRNTTKVDAVQTVRRFRESLSTSSISCVPNG
ncbi:hypothetical protein QR680_007948 [Steinernema hermaphroditum]|uniref:Uncharacterized protein n=1 Tax=Steinernema hermaphroditum TaxID=289476 RepID=A0AA39IES6_9BILA|nr:hypothetical protein QR680_007948 [Steinernema hermaphroditum]